jgi:signal transduction histidine kinase
MLFAITWWSILLNKKNTEAFIAKSELIKLENEKTFGVSEYDLSQNESYQLLEKKFKKQQYMILGEGLVFASVIIIGIWLINRSFQRELDTSKRQQNFLLSITHELKSPLAGIGLVLDTLHKRQLDHEKVQSLCVAASSEKNRLQKLIDNLLMAAKIDSSYTYNMESLKIQPIVVAIIDTFQELHPNVHLTVDVDPHIYALIDKEAFISVVTNLLENAYKYRVKDRDLLIEIKTEVLTPSKTVSLSVADNGIGIAKQETKKIFNKFYRVGSEQTRTTKGTGLGLYIVQKIMENHKGSITIQPNQPNGSIFVTTWKANKHKA